MAQKIITQWNEDGTGDHGVVMIGDALDLDATLRAISEKAELGEEERQQLEGYANGGLALAELHPNLRRRLAHLGSQHTPHELFVHGVGSNTFGSTAQWVDNVAGNDALADLIATHPQAKFIWGDDPLAHLKAISLRAQLEIFTQYWGGHTATARRAANMSPREGGPSAEEVTKQMHAWDNFSHKTDRRPPDITIILRIWNNAPPLKYSLDHPLPILSDLILRQSQLTIDEHAQIRQLPARELYPFFLNIYKNSIYRDNPRHQTKIDFGGWQVTFSAEMISKDKVQKITKSLEDVGYRLDGGRPLPDLARAITAYFTRNHMDIPPSLNEATRLQQLAEILCMRGLGGTALANQMRSAGVKVGEGNAFSMRLDKARRGIGPYWSDDWDKVKNYLAQATMHKLEKKSANRRKKEGKYRRKKEGKYYPLDQPHPALASLIAAHPEYNVDSKKDLPTLPLQDLIIFLKLLYGGNRKLGRIAMEANPNLTQTVVGRIYAWYQQGVTPRCEDLDAVILGLAQRNIAAAPMNALPAAPSAPAL